jgi:hypothetical protein
MRSSLVATGLVLVMAVPAFADSTTKEPHKVSLETALTIKPATARGARDTANLTYKAKLSRTDGGRPTAVLNRIDIKLGKGITFDPAAQAACDDAVFDGFNDNTPANPANCPKGSVVGSGTATVDARPAVAQPLKAPMKVINGILSHDDKGNAVAPKKVLFVYAEAAGQKVWYVANFVKSGNGLSVPLSTAPPGSDPGLFIITGLDLKITGKGKSAKKPFLRGPQTCGPLTFTSTYVLDGAPLTAKDELVCD